MTQSLILASQSDIRRRLLKNAGVAFEAVAARVDEDAVRAALLGEAAAPRDIADALAGLKARKISECNPGALVIGCDQVLSQDGELLSKPASPDDARKQLRRLRGQRHELLSAVVICEDGKPLWRTVATVGLTMRDFTDNYLTSYVERNWDSIRHSVGAYKLEEEGVRLFSRIDGDYFTVLGLPLLDLLTFLGTRGVIER